MNHNKFTFDTENLVVDWIGFNIQGTADFELVNRISKYLFQYFAFNSIISNCSESSKNFSDKNKHQVEFAFYKRAPELGSLWDGTQIRFSGKNATRFYQLIQQQKINWHLLKPQNSAELKKLTLNRVDLCYSKTKKDIDTNQPFEPFEFFLKSCYDKILQNSRTKHIQYDRNERGFILKIGSIKSPNYYRVYENSQEIRFELEMKSSILQSVQDFLFNDQIPEFEQILTKHFYNHSNKILVLDQGYTDWLIKYFRNEAGEAGFLVPFFNQSRLSLSDSKKVFGLLQFLSFIRTIPSHTFEIIMLQHQSYYGITFPLKDFAKFLGEEEKYKNYGDRYRRKKYIQFFMNIQHTKPLITAFSDQKFQSSAALLTVSIDKINFDWVVQLSIAKELYFYDYPFILANSLVIYKNTYELQIRLQILQNFSVNYLKKTLDVHMLLKSFNASQKRHADNKIEIIRQLDQLPIQKQYELRFKNGKIKRVTKLTPLLIGKTQTMHFYEKL